jgi:hypothetical protein
MNVVNRSNLTDNDFSVFRNELAQHRSLQDLLKWAEKQSPGTLVPGAIAELVVQDEFTHDLVVPWRGFYVVYGTT